MPQTSSSSLFSLLPDRRPPWKEFLFSTAGQGLGLAVLVWIGLVHPEVITQPAHDYHFVHLVDTPQPISLRPQPISRLQAPQPAAKLVLPPPEAMPATRPVNMQQASAAPAIALPAAKPAALQPAEAAIPRQLVKTNVFSTGSSEPATIAQAPEKVQTGGFGDPNGVRAQPTNGRPVTIASLGSFDMPGGPGNGNGSGGARGKPGVVASAGFGNGTATGNGSAAVSASRGTVRQGGFGDAEPVQQAVARSKTADTATPHATPVEITAKPNPVYTEEARQLRVEGEVLLEVVFEATGKIRVVRVVRGLGHGLDEAAMRAAEQIRFKPAMRDGQPADSTVVLHIVFQLA
jgi:TonB family protein